MLCLIIRQLYQSENILSISIERDGMLPVSCISHFSWARLLIILAAPATPSTACRWSESSVWAATVRPSPKPPWPQAPHGAGIQFKPAPSLPVTLNCKHRIKYGLHIVTRRHLCMLGLSYQFAVFSRKKFCQLILRRLVVAVSIYEYHGDSPPVSIISICHYLHLFQIRHSVGLMMTLR